MWQLQRNLTEDRGIMMNQMSRDVQNSLVHLHLVHTKNNIDSLAIQDDKTSREHSHDKLEWDFMGHPIGNHSADGSGDIIWHFCSTESKLSLLSTCLLMKSSDAPKLNYIMIGCSNKKNVPARTSSPGGISLNIVKLAQPTLEDGGRIIAFY
jgi:hypothetical protein